MKSSTASTSGRLLDAWAALVQGHPWYVIAAALILIAGGYLIGSWRDYYAQPDTGFTEIWYGVFFIIKMALLGLVAYSALRSRIGDVASVQQLTFLQIFGLAFKGLQYGTIAVKHHTGDAFAGIIFAVV